VLRVGNFAMLKSLVVTNVMYVHRNIHNTPATLPIEDSKSDW